MVGENMNELMDQVHVQNLMPEEAKMVPVMLTDTDLSNAFFVS